MFQYSNRRMGSTTRWWRRRRLAGRLAIDDPAAIGLLVAAGDPPAVFTPAEDAEVAEGYASQRTIEATYNRSLRQQLRALAKRAPQLERRKVDQLRLAGDAHDADQRLRRAEQAERAMRDHGRHLPRWARIALVVLLAVVDVAAYRAAVEVAFDTSDEWPAIVDSYLLALLSLGMVMAAMFAAMQLKALHSSRDRRLVDAAHVADDQAHARRVWLQAGVPSLLCALALLGAGAALRVNALFAAPRWFWIAVPAFSASALVGAFFVEYAWASKALDERDDLERRSRRAHRRLRRADRKLAGVEGDYRMRQAEIAQLWSLYEPGWRVQLEMAAARIASARAEHPELFHPLATSVVESVHERIARGTTRRDPHTGLAELELTVERVLARAGATHAQRIASLSPHADASALPVMPASPSLTEPLLARRNGHDPVPVDVSRVQR